MIINKTSKSPGRSKPRMWVRVTPDISKADPELFLFLLLRSISTWVYSFRILYMARTITLRTFHQDHIPHNGADVESYVSSPEA